MLTADYKLQRVINNFAFVFIALHLAFSLFLSEYFIELPSILKEVFYIPLLLLFVVWALFYPQHLRINPTFYPFVAWLVLFAVIGIFNNAPDTFAIRYYLFTTFTYVFIQQFVNEAIAKMIFKLLVVYFIGMVIVGFVDLARNYDNFVQIIASEFFFEELKINRLYLWFNIANIAGGVLAVVTLFFYFYTGKKWALYFGIPVMFVVFSRTSLASFLISLLLYWTLKNRKKPLFIVFVSIVFIALINFLIAYSTQDFAFNDRIELSKSVLAGDINYMGKGIGFVTASGRVAEIVVFDNDYLRFIYEIGVIGLILYLVFIGTALSKYLSIETACFTFNFLVMMYMGEIHSMYPIGFLFYMCLALLQYKLSKDDIVPGGKLEWRRGI